MDHRQRESAPRSTSWAMIGVIAAGLLCCGLPVLLVTLGMTAAGTFLLVNRFYIFGGILVILGVGAYFGWRRSRRNRKGDRDGQIN